MLYTNLCSETQIKRPHNKNAETFGNVTFNSLSVGVRKRQVAILVRSSREMSLFVSSESTSCHEFASQFGRAIFLYAKNIQNLWEIWWPACEFI